MRIVLNNIDEQKIIDAVYAAGQGHVFRFWNELGLESRTKLLAQLGEIDLARLVAGRERSRTVCRNECTEQVTQPISGRCVTSVQLLVRPVRSTEAL